jgi:transcriptional regulator with XRE-family HTH domain
MDISGNLKKARENKRWSQKEVAEHLSISQKTLSNFESGISSPSIRQLALLANLYEMPIFHLLAQPEPALKGTVQKQFGTSPHDNHYSTINLLYEKLIREKDLRIRNLEEAMNLLKDR